MSRHGRSIGAAAVLVLVVLGASACAQQGDGRPRPDPTSSTSARSADACAPWTAPAANRVVPYSALSPGENFSAQVSGAGGRVVRMGAGSIALGDFAPVGSTFDAGQLGPGATGLIGAGADRTVFTMTPHVSTRAADVPTVRGAPNQLSVLQVVGDRAVLHGFSVVGTDQGHLYNGLRVARVHGLRASDIAVSRIPGDSSSPPGETFGINDFRTVGSQWSDIRVDGAGVGASGFGINSSRDVLVCGSVSRDNPVSMGFAVWQSSGVRLVDCAAIDNGYSGFNFERSTGRNVLIRPVATGNRYAMRVASDQASAKFTIIDPRLVDGTWTVSLPKRWNHTANRQRPEDITLIVDGRPRPDLLRIVTY